MSAGLTSATSVGSPVSWRRKTFSPGLPSPARVPAGEPQRVLRRRVLAPRVLDEPAHREDHQAKAHQAGRRTRAALDQRAAGDGAAHARVGQFGQHGLPVDLGGRAVVPVLDRDLVRDELLDVDQHADAQAQHGDTEREADQRGVEVVPELVARVLVGPRPPAEDRDEAECAERGQDEPEGHDALGAPLRPGPLDRPRVRVLDEFDAVHLGAEHRQLFPAHVGELLVTGQLVLAAVLLAHQIRPPLKLDFQRRAAPGVMPSLQSTTSYQPAPGCPASRR